MKIDNMEYVLSRLKAMKERLSDYAYTQSSLLDTNVSTDFEYQDVFGKFYVLKCQDGTWLRDGRWREIFFSILEHEKRNDKLSFQDVLKEIYHTARHKQRQQIEASFSSKLLATVRPEMPVWDTWVLKNLGIENPSDRKYDYQKRIDKRDEIYSRIQDKMSKIIGGVEFPEWKRRFDSTFPEYTHFTDTKKLDLYLWQSR